MSAATTPDPKNIDDLLAAGSRRRPHLPPVSEGGSPATPALPESASPAFRRGTFQLTEENDLHLHQLSYHTPGSRGDKSYIVNRALEEYLAKQPRSREAIPEEDAVRRRGRRHH